MATKENYDNSALDDEYDYHESSDEDFDPNTGANSDGNNSSGEGSEEEVESVRNRGSHLTSPGKSRNKASRISVQDHEAEDIGFENSGDELIVKKGTKRKRKHGKAVNDDSDNELHQFRGGFVKTRRMHAEAAEEHAKRSYLMANSGPVTIDINDLWAEMNDPGKSKAAIATDVMSDAVAKTRLSNDEGEFKTMKGDGNVTITRQEEDLIEIEETYKFAGEVHTLKKLVPRSSSEARKWMKENGGAPSLKEDIKAIGDNSAALSRAKRHPDTGEPLLRPLRRVSLWDPNPTGIVKGIPANILSDSATAANKLRVVDKSKLGWYTDSQNNSLKPTKTTRLNVVEKSKLDWQAHVDEVGDQDELQKAAKAKNSYLERREFLDRVGARKDERERVARTK